MTHRGDMLIKRKSAEIIEWLFLLVTGFYLICQCIYNSTYVLPAYTFPDRPVFQLILCATAILALGRMILTGLRNIRTVLIVLAAAIFFLAYRTGRELFLLMIPVLTAGVAGVDYRKVLKVYVASVGSFLAVTILCAFTGVIENIIYTDGGRFRSSLGIAYPTDMASFVLFFVMALWLAWDGMPDSLAVFTALVSVWFSLVVAASKTSVLCSLMFLVIILTRKLCGYLTIEKKERGKFKIDGFFLLVFSFLFFSAAFFSVMIFYARDVEAGKTLDWLLSGRLSMTLTILKDTGLQPFGSNFSQVGLGGSTIHAGTYYFLDSSYAMLLIRYGWVLFVTVAAFWTGMGLRAYQVGDQKLLWIMTVIAFHAMSEHHFLDVHYNILLVLPFAEIPKCTAPQRNRESFLERARKNWTGNICAAMMLVMGAYFAPVLLSRLRTVFEIWKNDSTQGKLLAVQWCVLLLLTGGISLRSICLFTKQLWKQKRVNKKRLAISAVGLIMLIGIARADSNIIDSADKPGWISPEREAALVQILDSAEGRVFVCELPELSHRHFPGISRSIWYGQDLARQKNSSVVVNLEENSIAFQRMGFRFSQISPEDAIYSNDPAAIEGLADAGYQWTAYDAAVREVDLGAFAEFNELSLTEEGSIVLENGRKLNHGPYMDFYAGTYRITFELKTDGSAGTDEPLCSLYVTTLEGRSFAEKTVGPENLKDDGTCSAELVFETPDIRYLQFPVFPAAGRAVEVTGIRFQQIG